MKIFMFYAVLLVYFREVVCDDYGIYPSSFPFESDSSLPPLTRASPSYQFSESDPGGYVSQIFLSTSTLDRYSAPPFKLFNFGYLDYFMYGKNQKILSDRQGFTPAGSKWLNCTGKNKIDETYYPGIMGNTNIQCAGDKCCVEYFGHWCQNPAASVIEYDGTIDQMNELGGCVEPWSEAMYCSGTTNLFMCTNNVLTRSERIKVGPCIDLFIKYYAKCPLYMVAGNWYTPLETKLYERNGTPLDSLYIMAVCLLFVADRVCFPSSYYSPADVVPNSSPKSSMLNVIFVSYILTLIFM